MSIFQIIQSNLYKWIRSAPPASEAEIEQLRHDAGVALPASFFEFYRCTNGGEGELEIDPGWIWIYAASKVVEHHNGYDVAERLPG